MAEPRVTSFTSDALGTSDAVELSHRLTRKEISPVELVEAAIARAEALGPTLNAMAHEDFEAARLNARLPRSGFFGGVPTLIKDNVDLAGQPTNHGSAAWTASPARHHSPFVKHFLRSGVVPLGKSRLPELGFNASTEYVDAPPTRNPWNPAYSSGASSGGSAAFVAAGVVPIAHANDGGGSIRIPAAACGLVGLKPTRGRTPDDLVHTIMPVRIIAEGVVTRSVRDTAAFYRELERTYRPRRLPPIGDVTGPSSRRLRIGLHRDSPVTSPDAQVGAALEDTAQLLRNLGHEVREMDSLVDEQFVEDFSIYWQMLAALLRGGGQRIFDPSFDPTRVDTFTAGLADAFMTNRAKLPGVVRRLRRSSRLWSQRCGDYDVVLSPTLAHTTPKLGYIAPGQDFDQHFSRLLQYVAYTPLQNATGDPAISLPLGRSDIGMPIGMHFGAGPGEERILLALAYELEQARPWPLITEPADTLSALPAQVQPRSTV
ncbi:amidase [Epidermidibacterium keratini]|uniref:Amidase n=1 Tax=Epidermidibacterium keratini TaxID=1891644 RepID=A0A7L4YN29_9ACTN|nr:amidase [Epidermidibacterium keratini]QHC00560.1 amidase [Epidermidibacterium keratini]